MRILLIRPPHDHMIRTNVPKSVEVKTGCYPPLGLLYVAAAVKKWANAQIEILDAPALGFSQQEIQSYLTDKNYNVVGIQTMTFNLVDAIQTVQTVKSILSDVHISLGGPHVNLYPEETLKIEGVDSLVLGEGERTFPEMVNVMGQGGNFADVAGVAVLRDGHIQIKPRPLEENLDELPNPARELIDSSRYWSVLAKKNPITTAMTSRGCPMKCIFCDRPHLGKTFRYRSAKSVVDEMQNCVNAGIQEIFLYDDTFTIKRDRIFEVRDEIRKRGLKVRWDVRARANTLDDEVVKAMKDSGITRIHIGVESGSPKVLKAMKKGITVEQAYNAFELCKKNDITSLSYFMFGNLDETWEDAEMTMKFIRTCKADYAHISITTPFPGTELYSLGLEKGLYKEDYWRKFATDPDENFVPPAWIENFSQKELEDIRRKAYRAFYTKPGRLMRELFAVRSFKELRSKINLGLSLLYKRDK